MVPCYSRVETKITDAARLVEALKARGYTDAVLDASGLVVHGGGVPLFQRSRVGAAFSSVQYQSNLDAAAVGPIARKYAELGARAWAKRSGFAVQSSSETEMVFLKRG